MADAPSRRSLLTGVTATPPTLPRQMLPPQPPAPAGPPIHDDPLAWTRATPLQAPPSSAEPLRLDLNAQAPPWMRGYATESLRPSPQPVAETPPLLKETLKTDPYFRPFADLTRGLTVGSNWDDPNETPAAFTGELIQTGAPLLKGVAAGVGLVKGGLKIVGQAGNIEKAGKLWSRVDDVATQIGKKGVHPNKLQSLLKSGASQEEVAYRRIPEWLASRPNPNAPITLEEMQAHLAKHPAPQVETTVLGETAERRAAQERLNELARLGPDRTWGQDNEYESLARRLRHGQEFGGAPKFSSYTLPGGESYRESLIQHRPTDPTAAEQFEFFPKTGDRLYRTSHFDQPNILTHVRHKERTLPTGERGRFLEEIQSDWHQQGKRRGYQSPPSPEDERRLTELRDEIEAGQRTVADVNHELRQAANQRLDQMRASTRPRLAPEYAHLTSFSDATQQGSEAVDAWRRARELAWNEPGDVQARAAEQAVEQRLRDAVSRVSALQEEQTALYTKAQTGVPDAPFKETWPDLALKQQLLDVSRNHPDLSFLGFTSGKTQAARYDLSKQVSKIEYDPIEKRLVAYDHEGERVINEAAEPEELADYIGKEPAEKLAEQINRHEQSRVWERSQWGVEEDVDKPGRFFIYDPNGELLYQHGGTPERYTSMTEANARIDELLNDTESPMANRELPMLEGLDLQVGGEGMHSFYDRLLPKRLEKILKPFGGTVERGALPITKQEMVDTPGFSVRDRYGHTRGWWRTREEADAYRRNPPPQMTSYVGPESEIYEQVGSTQAERQVDEPAWFARLTPEIKNRLLKEGLPLMALPLVAGAAALQNYARQQQGDQIGTAPPVRPPQ